MELLDNFTTLITSEYEHSCNLEYAHALDQADEHDDEKRSHNHNTRKRHPAGAASVDPGQCAKGVKEGGSEHTSRVRHHGVSSVVSQLILCNGAPCRG